MGVTESRELREMSGLEVTGGKKQILHWRASQFVSHTHTLRFMKSVKITRERNVAGMLMELRNVYNILDGELKENATYEIYP